MPCSSTLITYIPAAPLQPDFSGYSPPSFPSAKSEFYGRKTALLEALAYVKDAMNQSPKVLCDDKFSLLGTSGMKGIGKSELLKQVGTKINITEIHATATYIAFNGGGRLGSIFLAQLKKGVSCEDAFAQLLLTSCGVPTEAIKTLDIEQAMAEYRKLHQLDDAHTLVICVDEIGFLPDIDAMRAISALMSLMDASKGKLIFIFAHINEEFLDKASTWSGRKVIPLALPPLDIDIWTKNPELQKASTHSALHQLFLSCSGHPRAIFDGLRVACDENPTLLSAPTMQAIAIARKCVIWECKFNDIHDNVIMDAVQKWFSQSPPSEDDVNSWSQDGLLHTMKGPDDVQFLFPLLVQDWATRRSARYPIAYHLQQLYAADAALDLDSEKNMEPLMYHYEAVLRIAQQGKPFRLHSFYHSSNIGIPDQELTAKLHDDKFPVVELIHDFSDMPKVLEQLNLGKILVSEKHSEVGVEYLVPYRDHADSLIVAAVQCKFVRSSVSWKEIARKMETAIAGVAKNVKVFPVVYTTVDQECLHASTFANGVYFVEKDICNFTKRLGVLRLHMLKLGEYLKTHYPVFARARSDLSVKKQI